jgi:hypothetical protein
VHDRSMHALALMRACVRASSSSCVSIVGIRVQRLPSCRPERETTAVPAGAGDSFPAHYYVGRIGRMPLPARRGRRPAG